MPAVGLSELELASLPAVLAGPVLRRLTRRDVAVWIAVSSGAALQLKVRRPGGPAVASSPPVTPVRVGVALWLAVLQAPSPDANGEFQADQAYEYWIEGGGVPAVGDPWWADTVGLSAG